MTSEEKQEIVQEVLSAIRTNSVQITDLTEVQEIPTGGFIEISGGRRISANIFLSLIQTAIEVGLVTPLNQRVNTLEANVNLLSSDKFDKSSVVQSQGSSQTLVMSQQAVTDILNSLNVQIGRINVAKGTNNTTVYEIKYTNTYGSVSTITIPSATLSKAGLLSAQDKTHLEDLITDKITNIVIEPSPNDVSVQLPRNDDTLEAVIPTAGTIPEGEESPVAGVMSAEQAEDLNAVLLEVFPLKVNVSYTNSGWYEKGVSVSPNVSLNISRRGVGVARNVTLTTPMEVDSRTDNTIILRYSQITENTSFNIAVHHKGSTVNVVQQQYRFANFVYGDILSAMPVNIVNSIVSSRILRELSMRTTYDGTLQAGKLFLFAVPGNVSLFCKHAETGADISGCTKGTCQVPRQTSETTDLYSYIIVPASDVAWNFKITNS